ncbi:MAG: hypothetical protein ORN28_01535 [Rhodoferax sp.]|nr:hypothetical protein [Rhodoferax sp.]
MATRFATQYPVCLGLSGLQVGFKPASMPPKISVPWCQQSPPHCTCWLA